MKTNVLFPTFLLICFANVSLACTPEPGHTYDTLRTTETAILVAKVLSAETELSDNNVACTKLKYSVTETLLGNVPPVFNVLSCYEDVSIKDLSQSLNRKAANDHIGFSKNAEVVVGIVKKNNDKYRYAVPSCWGPAHLRVDTLDSEERKRIFSEIKDDMADGGLNER